MEYFPWEPDFEDATFANIHRIPDKINQQLWKLHKGISCKEWFPGDVTFGLDQNSGVALGDSIPNSLNILIVSKKLRDILAAATPDFEFFPVSVLNAKKKKVKADYFVANLVGTIHCADMTKSEYKISNIDKTQVRRFTRLVLEEDNIPEGTQIFRLGEKTELYIVNDPLGDHITEAECTGMDLTYLEDYGMDFRGE